MTKMKYWVNKLTEQEINIYRETELRNTYKSLYGAFLQDKRDMEAIKQLGERKEDGKNRLEDCISKGQILEPVRMNQR